MDVCLTWPSLRSDCVMMVVVVGFGHYKLSAGQCGEQMFQSHPLRCPPTTFTVSHPLAIIHAVCLLAGLLACQNWGNALVMSPRWSVIFTITWGHRLCGGNVTTLHVCRLWYPLVYVNNMDSYRAHMIRECQSLLDPIQLLSARQWDGISRHYWVILRNMAHSAQTIWEKWTVEFEILGAGRFEMLPVMCHPGCYLYVTC